MPKPRVLTKCVANAYTTKNERIIEYCFPGSEADGSNYAKGGLIRFTLLPDARGKLVPRVELYRHDKGIVIHKGKAE